jgi:hypothetical protein
MTEHDTLLIQIAKDLATNTEATKNIERQLITLNGKVANHETRMQASEAAQAITTTAVATIQQARDKQRTRLYDILERAGWAVSSVLAIGVWKLISYLIETDILKQLFK